MNLQDMTALELGRALKDGKLGCVELTKSFLDNISQREPHTNAYITVLEEQSLRRAEEMQQRISGGEELSPLAGVPMAIKDNICTEDIKTTCGSRMLADFSPPYAATAAQRLEEAGAVLLGKTNMDEFAMGGSSETSYFGAVVNPWDETRVPGGSSGGSAAAVAAGEAAYALGSDTGGSIRQPCSFCGVTGIKPTYGAVSRYGLVAYASSLDQIGPIGRTVEDCAAILTLISGHDAKDSTSLQNAALDFSGAFTGDVKGLKIGIPRGYFGEGLEEEVGAAVLTAAKTLESLGATIEEFDLPLVEYAVPAYYVIACAEASSNLSRYDGVKYGFRSEKAGSLADVYDYSRSEGFGMEVKRRIMLGSFVLSSGYYDAYYKKGLQARGLIQGAFLDAFAHYDMILGPVAPTTAYRMGENITDPLKMYLGDIYTVAVNLAGLPAVAIPCGADRKGLPIGMQLIGKALSEPTLVRAAHAFQLNTAYHQSKPAIVKGGGEA
jgi:aspartyl-tRNA(Asn)/glutamyl-tRNA(Gln) amidotransferase subunit A